MLTAGIDAGAEYLKVVLLSDSNIVSHSILAYEHEPILTIANKGLSQATEKAGVTEQEIDFIAATGGNREAVSFSHEQVTEPRCCTRGATWLFPSTKTVIDLGAEKCLVMKCRNGIPLKFARSDKCASGTGRYLQVICKLLGIEVDDMGPLSLKSQKNVDIQSTCTIFAESEAISLIHQNYAPEDIMWGAIRALAARIRSLIVGVGLETDVTMIGGIAKNIGVIKALEQQTSCNILVAEEPMIGAALGAAIVAAESKRSANTAQ